MIKTDTIFWPHHGESGNYVRQVAIVANILVYPVRQELGTPIYEDAWNADMLANSAAGAFVEIAIMEGA